MSSPPPGSWEALHDRLSAALDPLRFGPPVTHVYNPLEYARAPLDEYFRRYGASPKEVVLVGMNPGPWGMAQTGIPFGAVELAGDWLGLRAPVGRPLREHPRRPILGFDCPRREVSGARLWGWARERFGSPTELFRHLFVLNYCPLVFMEASGRNRTPDQLPARERAPLFAACDVALREAIGRLGPARVIGIGRFAEARARQALADLPVEINGVAHPSPANPGANRGWAALMDRALEGSPLA